MTLSLRLIPLLPLLGATYLMLFGRRHSRGVVGAIATSAVGLAALLALNAFFRHLPAVAHQGGLRDSVWTWFTSGALNVELALRMDVLSGLLSLVVTVIATLIHIYSTGYMAHEKDYARFFAYLNLFCGTMLVLVLGDSLPVMFIGWEGVGLCSYLLIGFWYGEAANANAGKKAFITNRVGDFGFLVGMFLLFRATGTLDMASLVGLAREGGGALIAPLWLGQPVAFWAALFLFVGAAGKSAQIPLYVWLPDAMAGPTPVSALIHAATMVTAGVYMVARLGAVYMLAPVAMAVVAVVGAATALWAALIAFGQNDFKKVLAYSTVSQLGFMFVGVGTGNFAGGVFHLYTHAFFKAGLFLCAGSVMHAMSGSGDITRMGGLQSRMPVTTRVFQVCWLAICGFPLFSGFFSKDALLAGAFSSAVFGPRLSWVGPLVGAMLLLAALGTAFYMSRLCFLVFTGPCRADARTQAHIHESPLSMTVPLVILAAGAAVAGFVGLPPVFGGHNLLGTWLEPAVGPEPHVAASLEWGVMGTSTLIVGAGIGLAYLFFGGGYRAPSLAFSRAVPRLVSAVRAKLYVDEIYAAVVVRPLAALSRALFSAIDRVLIDRLLVGGMALLTDGVGRLARMVQAGDVQRQVAVFAIGLAILFYGLSRPAKPNQVSVSVQQNFVVVKLPGAETAAGEINYGFDFDGDGQIDRSGPTPSASWSYAGAGRHRLRIVIADARWQTSRVVEREVETK